MQLPQPIQRLWLTVTFSPAPLLQYFTGHAAIQAWQFTHFSSSTLMTAGSSFAFIHHPLAVQYTTADVQNKLHKPRKIRKTTKKPGTNPILSRFAADLHGYM
jgi:hypothetical protein